VQRYAPYVRFASETARLGGFQSLPNGIASTHTTGQQAVDTLPTPSPGSVFVPAPTLPTYLHLYVFSSSFSLPLVGCDALLSITTTTPTQVTSCNNFILSLTTGLAITRCPSCQRGQCSLFRHLPLTSIVVSARRVLYVRSCVEDPGLVFPIPCTTPSRSMFPVVVCAFLSHQKVHYITPACPPAGEGATGLGTPPPTLYNSSPSGNRLYLSTNEVVRRLIRYEHQSVAPPTTCSPSAPTNFCSLLTIAHTAQRRMLCSA
jgi:hypothetical protein